MSTSKNRMITIMAALFVSVFFNLLTVANAQIMPFDIDCDANSGAVIFLEQGNVVYHLSLQQLAMPLTVARSSKRNQIIVSNGVVSVWALHSSELQVHYDSNPDSTKLVVSADICGAIPPVTDGQVAGQAFAFAQADAGGQAVAIAQVTADGEIIAVASVVGPGVAVAYVDTVSTGENYYIVQEGDNLFRIALSNATTVAELTRINGLSDPASIWVGQTIYLP
jgi:LysM repeat protein